MAPGAGSSAPPGLQPGRRILGTRIIAKVSYPCNTPPTAARQGWPAGARSA